MRRLPRNPFHHSDLGGAFLAFAPKFGDDEEDVTREKLPDDPSPSPAHHRRSFVRALIRRLVRRKPDSKVPLDN
jgi:hypothetical protein